jgi:hypothetical protein
MNENHDNYSIRKSTWVYLGRVCFLSLYSVFTKILISTMKIEPENPESFLFNYDKIFEAYETPKVHVKFRNYEFVVDLSWLPRDQTPEQADREMQHSISMNPQPNDMTYIWIDDFEMEYHLRLPPYTDPGKKERTLNSFLQYRNLVQRAFIGRQTEISKTIEGMWRAESEEMKFYCTRSAEMENRISLVDDY